MSTEVKLPELGENIDSGTVVKLLVSVGQKIDQDQPLMELETDKATISKDAFDEGMSGSWWAPPAGRSLARRNLRR